MQPQAASVSHTGASSPFSDFAPPVQVASALRIAIAAAHVRPEHACLPPLLAAARCPDEHWVQQRARQLTGALRARRPGNVAALLNAYSLASDEGVALMCLAEALLRIPDAPTRDALVRDKIVSGDWRAHLGRDRPLFVNAATWALMLTSLTLGQPQGRPDAALPANTASHPHDPAGASVRKSSTRPHHGTIHGTMHGAVDDRGLGAVLDGLLARAGAPVVRAGINLAMHLLGDHFVAGPDINTALQRSAARETRGYRHSYDMLGEAAMTADDAAQYFRAYEGAIHAVGAAARGAGCIDRPSISVKLSALHPRYCRAQAERVMTELAPRLKSLALAARSHDIGLTIDAEEADRLELSLDLFERLRLDLELAGWSGLGFVVQAYGKRAPYVIDWLVDLARRSGARIMVRLVKGAYWDTEIKRAQAAGLSDFPVFTRKLYTDVSWLACARKLLDAGDAVYPQFATHNARSVAGVMAMASGRSGDSYEFQCLFGMGEPLYDQLLAAGNAPCRIYAPVGPHGALLAYLVRRLLENGANTSFVRQAADPDASIDALVADPVAMVAAMPNPGAPHAAIRAPAALFAPQRRNSAGIDLASEADLAALQHGLDASAARQWQSQPATVAAHVATRGERVVVNPGDHRDLVGVARELAPDSAGAVAAAARTWSEARPAQRAACLERAADAMEATASVLAGLVMREAGKTAASALAEVREAVDYLRYYGAQARALPADAPGPLGTLLCISPWNFPLAIFTGQIAAALAAGNGVIAKPSEATPLIAAEAVRILHDSGAPRAVLQLAPGDGEIGAALAAAPEVAGVLFTGSHAVAQKLNRQLAARACASDGHVPLLIAETGGLNCMIVDSSALTEQVVADVLTSAFDSAGQRCSALRVLCLQEEIAAQTLTMLRGAMDELSIGCASRLAIDIGPVINADAQRRLEAHIRRLSDAGRRVHRLTLPDAARHGSFVAPTLIEINSLADVPDEAFGPVLHVLRWRRPELDALVDAINDTGFGLTFGLHTRLDGTIEQMAARIQAGNIYVNRNMIGAVVGAQPFGGRGLSGTGPKAGGPLMLPALMRAATSTATPATAAAGSPAVAAFATWLDAQGAGLAAATTRRMVQSVPPERHEILPGPVGEANSLHIAPIGLILLAPVSTAGLYSMIAAALATGNRAVILSDNAAFALDFPPNVAASLSWRRDINAIPAIGAALLEGTPARLADLRQQLAAREGAIIPTLAATPEAIAARPDLWALHRLLDETALSVNTAAAGGNADLLTLEADARPRGEGAVGVHKPVASAAPRPRSGVT